VRLDVDIEGELTRELVGASSQIGRTDVLPVTEQRAALVFAGRIASLHGLGLAVLVVIGLTTEHAIAIHFFLALILDHAQALGLAIRALVAGTTTFALRIAVVGAIFLTFAVVTAEASIGNGTFGAAVGAPADADLVRALAAVGLALLGTGVRARFRTALDIRRRATLAAHAVGLLRADLLNGRSRAGRLALLDRLEFTVGINAQEHASTLIECLGLRQARHE